MTIGLEQGAQDPAPEGTHHTSPPAQLLTDALECLPDAVTVSVVVRDGSGKPADMRLEYMNAAARAGQPDGAAPVGGLCSELWPQMIENGSFAACMRVLETGRPEQGAFTWTQYESYRTAPYEYHATRLGRDRLLWVLRDNSERVLRAELLAQVTASLAAVDTVASVTDVLTEQIMPAVGAAAGAAVLNEPGSDHYSVRHIHGADDGVTQPAPFSISAPYPMAHTARTGQPLFFTDPADRTRAFPEAAHFFTPRYHSTAVLPLAVDERNFGAVSFHFSDRHDFTDSERGFLTALVGQCALAMESARLKREAAGRQAQLRTLADVSAVLATSLDPATTYANVAAAVVPRVADGCLIHVIGASAQPDLAALAHRDPHQEEVLRELLDDFPPRLDAEGGVGAVIRTGRHELVTDVPRTLDRLARDAEHRAALGRLLPAASWLTVPMKEAGKVIGAMVLIQATPAQTPFTETDIPFAEELAGRAAQAVTNARRFTEQSEVAHYLQRSLMPPALPDIPGVEIAACYRPGDHGTLVGGDFYDIVPTGPHLWSLAIGDVCGKGPQAAALTGLVRHTARAARLWDPDPRSVLQAVNTAIIADHFAQRFCTAAYAHLDLRTSPVRLRLTLAGHPHPLVRRADGTVTRLGRPGTLLGIISDPPLRTTDDELHPGDLLLLYTDGVTERRSGAGMLSEDGIRDVLTRTRHSSAADTVAELERSSTSAPRPPTTTSPSSPCASSDRHGIRRPPADVPLADAVFGSEPHRRLTLPRQPGPQCAGPPRATDPATGSRLWPLWEDLAGVRHPLRPEPGDVRPRRDRPQGRCPVRSRTAGGTKREGRLGAGGGGVATGAPAVGPGGGQRLRCTETAYSPPV
ncbi:GAF domain-containing SpoIIE family protein phosphatase [Streptomyces sp. DH12]|uniref:GAF domain-containing SpoIIE family protein phosphatase n=1 Tax=Streptomyces sp. DH12 TaxID=2857010 RepID=UPI001E5AB7FC|nr:SpoIIE family protein phosphatase [Streptomyces sp. DH12]